MLVTEAAPLERTRLIEAAHRLGLPEIAVPRDVVTVDRLPLLGSGKPDYPAVLHRAREAARVESADEAALAQG